MSSDQKIKLAISTCPNDTFAFHGILERRIDLQGLEFDIQLLDIQQLNDGLFQHQFDVAKASFHAAALLTREYLVLPSGSALGFGVGPLLLAAAAQRSPNAHSTTLSPGQHTTAELLFRFFYGMATPVRRVEFSEIMPALQLGTADFGICIHEGRFTWESQGLALVEDLGERWEQETQAPLPLGGILARRQLPVATLQTIQSVIRNSIEYGHANRDETRSTMKRYAQELEDRVLFQHVDLYVNDWTLDLGPSGRDALNLLSEKAKRVGLVEAHEPPIEVFAP